MEQNKVKKFISKNRELLEGVAVVTGATAIAVGSYMLGYDKYRRDVLKFVSESKFFSAAAPLLSEAALWKGRLQGFVYKGDGFSADQLGSLGEVMTSTNSENLNLNGFTHAILFKKT